MKIQRLFFLLTLPVCFVYCKTTKQGNEVSHQMQPDNKIYQKSESVHIDSNIYRLTVSFYSRGEGTDEVVKKKYDGFINDFGKKNNVKLVYEVTHWGREGETDYCFKLLELRPTEQERFISDSKIILKESSLVHTEENIACKRKK